MKMLNRGMALAWLLAGSVYAIEGLPEAANWISNPSFEVGTQDCPVDWVFFNQHEITVGEWTAQHARSGAQGVAVVGRGGLAFGRWITPYAIPFEPGAKARVSFWYRGAGGTVYLLGRASSLNSSGIYSNDLSKNYKVHIGGSKLPPVKEWTYIEGEFAAPGYASWAQLCLGGNGREICEFDDITVARSGLILLAPTAPQLLAPGATSKLTVYAEELRAANPETVKWQVASDGFRLQSATLDAASKVWTLSIVATNKGVTDVRILALAGGKSLSLDVSRLARVFDGTGGTFAFAAMTDLHFYRPGKNERNDNFGRLVNSLNALDPLFAISLGDQLEIHSGYRDEEKKFEVEAVKEQLGRVQVPLFKVAGNHEIDKNYEGAGTQWYFEKLMQVTPYFSLEVDGAFIGGLDLSAPGICAREHGAAFLRAGQAAWISGLLGAYRGRLPILVAHIPPYNEFSPGPDRDAFMAMMFTNRVRAFLAGHLHYTKDEWVRNPVADKKLGPPWPAPQPLTNNAPLADRDNTVFLTTTTGSAFLLGGSPFNGYRYLLVRDQDIIWQDVLPISLAITRDASAPDSVTYSITNGADKAVAGLPLRAELPPGKVSAMLNGKSLPVQVTTNAIGHPVVWVQPDIATNAVATVVIRSE